MSEENTEKTKPEESKTLTKTPKKASAKKPTKKVDPQDDFLTNFLDLWRVGKLKLDPNGTSGS